MFAPSMVVVGKQNIYTVLPAGIFQSSEGLEGPWQQIFKPLAALLTQ